MTTIKLHNSKTRKKEVFIPIDPDNVQMYVCGPTVYDRAHLGNARPVVVFDVLFRLLRHVYGAEHVTYARNFTDVDDKINARAAESGREIGEITAETTQWFLDDMGALGALEPTHMPRATQYIPQMVAMIEDLIARGHAYAAEGHVLFAVDSWREGYGQLSGRSVDDMIAGARVEVAPYKKNPMDFVLWKPSDAEQPGWDSPWGRGRPGWHIECSAMSERFLGEQFDIHGGGIDLTFPHHENEIAQSQAAHGEGFARYWMHVGLINIDSQKMSKSLGNFFTIKEVLAKYPAEVVRYFLLSAHYRSPLNYSDQALDNARDALERIYLSLREISVDDGAEYGDYLMHFNSAMLDDFNTPIALSVIFDCVRELNTLKTTGDPNVSACAGVLKRMASLLGIGQQDPNAFLQTASSAVDAEKVESLIALRKAARAAKDFARADAIRDELDALGVVIEDGSGGTTWRAK